MSEDDSCEGIADPVGRLCNFCKLPILAGERAVVTPSGPEHNNGYECCIPRLRTALFDAKCALDGSVEACVGDANEIAKRLTDAEARANAAAVTVKVTLERVEQTHATWKRKYDILMEELTLWKRHANEGWDLANSRTGQLTEAETHIRSIGAACAEYFARHRTFVSANRLKAAEMIIRTASHMHQPARYCTTCNMWVEESKILCGNCHSATIDTIDAVHHMALKYVDEHKLDGTPSKKELNHAELFGE